MRVLHRPSIHRAGAALTLGLAAIGAQAAGLTGTYVGRSNHEAFVLQVVEAGSQLTGRYEQFVTKAGGKFEDTAFAFSASVDGGRFAGTIKNLQLLGSTIPVSGEVKGDALTLEGDASFHLALKRGEISDFRLAVADLRGASGAAQREASVRALTERMLAFEARLTQAISKLPGLEDRLAADTTKMASALDHERSIHGDGQRSVERGQISVGIHQIGVDAAQARSTVDADLGELHPASQQLVAIAGLARLGCTPKAGTPSAPLACPKLLEVDGSFKAAMEDGKAAFAKFDAVWDRENAVQAKLVRDSDTAVN